MNVLANCLWKNLFYLIYSKRFRGRLHSNMAFINLNFEARLRVQWICFHGPLMTFPCCQTQWDDCTFAILSAAELSIVFQQLFSILAVDKALWWKLSADFHLCIYDCSLPFQHFPDWASSCRPFQLCRTNVVADLFCLGSWRAMRLCPST